MKKRWLAIAILIYSQPLISAPPDPNEIIADLQIALPAEVKWQVQQEGQDEDLQRFYIDRMREMFAYLGRFAPELGNDHLLGWDGQKQSLLRKKMVIFITNREFISIEPPISNEAFNMPRLVPAPISNTLLFGGPDQRTAYLFLIIRLDLVLCEEDPTAPAREGGRRTMRLREDAFVEFTVPLAGQLFGYLSDYSRTPNELIEVESQQSRVRTLSRYQAQSLQVEAAYLYWLTQREGFSTWPLAIRQAVDRRKQVVLSGGRSHGLAVDVQRILRGDSCSRGFGGLTEGESQN